MRGKEQRRKRNENDMGITPAHAGKSSSVCVELSRSWDHPRTCGEKAWVGESKNNETGSPPHMRGKVTTPKYPVMDDRDHPRTCGEKQFLLSSPLFAVGSPPHMRGKVSLMGVTDIAPGITPAHAGKRLKRSRSIVPHAAIVPLFPSVCNKPAGSDGSPAGHDAPPFLPIENAVPASPAYNLRSL